MAMTAELPRKKLDLIVDLPWHHDLGSWANYVMCNENGVAAVVGNDVLERAVRDFAERNGVVPVVDDGDDGDR